MRSEMVETGDFEEQCYNQISESHSFFLKKFILFQLNVFMLKSIKLDFLENVLTRGANQHPKTFDRNQEIHSGEYGC